MCAKKKIGAKNIADLNMAGVTMKDWNLLKKRRINSMDNNYLWEKLKKHVGHRVEIVTYGNENDPVDVCLECEDCGEVILDVEQYTLCARDDLE